MQAAKNVYKFYHELPPWAKGTIVVGGALVTYLIVNGIVKRVKADAQSKKDKQEATDADMQLNALAKKGIRPTLSSAQFESMCLALVQSMNGCGTDEDAISNQFKKLNNEADVYALIKVFGIRYYMPCAASQPISYARYLYDDKTFGGTISTWLNYELTAGEINTYVNKALTSKGIIYQF